MKRLPASREYKVTVKSLAVHPKTGEDVDAQYTVWAFSTKEAITTVADMYSGTMDGVPYGIWAMIDANG